jgi:hypothetical protein
LPALSFGRAAALVRRSPSWIEPVMTVLNAIPRGPRPARIWLGIGLARRLRCLSFSLRC